MRSSVRNGPEEEGIIDQLDVVGDSPGRLPGRDDIQVGFYRMNRSLPKRQGWGVGDVPCPRNSTCKGLEV